MKIIIGNEIIIFPNFIWFYLIDEFTDVLKNSNNTFIENNKINKHRIIFILDIDLIKRIIYILIFSNNLKYF